MKQRRRLLLALAAASVAVAGYVVLHIAIAPLDTFRRGFAPDEIVVGAVVEPDDLIVRAYATEDANSVHVYVWILRDMPAPFAKHALTGLREDVRVQLSAPLGERSVRDGDRQMRETQ